MKKVLLLAAVLLSGCATHKQSVVDTRPAIASITHADATIKKIANAKPKEIAPLVKEADDELEQAEAQVQQVQKQADAVQNERDWWKADDASKDKQFIFFRKIFASPYLTLNRLKILFFNYNEIKLEFNF